MERAARRTLDAALGVIAAGLAVLIVDDAMRRPARGDRSALTRLARDPLDLPALRDLGLDLDRQGRLAEADATLRFVGGRTWRDGQAAAWLLRRRLDQGRYAEALQWADSLLRQDAAGTARPALFPLLIAAASDARARPALASRLAAAPWWRGDYLRTLAAVGDPEGARALFTTLARGRAAPSPDEYAPLINRLAEAGDYDGAFTLWRAIARPPARTARAVRDPDFAGASDNTPFTWSRARGVGAASETGLAPGGRATTALRVDYDGFSSPVLPAQLLVGAPSRFRVAWRERIDPASPARLAWRVRCADTNQVLARAASGAAGWRWASLTVVTPPAGCRAQWLELVADPGERREPVTAWYAGFRVTPVR